jgi:hypothetical protein
MSNEVPEIQQELARFEKRRGTRYPKELQERVAQLVRNLQGQGHSMVAINTLLGMTGDTLARWTRNSSNEPTAFVPVEVTNNGLMSSHGGELSLISLISFGMAQELLRVMPSLASIRAIKSSDVPSTKSPCSTAACASDRANSSAACFSSKGAFLMCSKKVGSFGLGQSRMLFSNATAMFRFWVSGSFKASSTIRFSVRLIFVVIEQTRSLQECR